MPLLACGWSQNYRGEGRGEKERGGEERGGKEKGGEERGGGGKGAERRREEREGVMPFKTISMHTPMSEISFFFLTLHVHWKNIALLADLHFHL